VYCDFGGCLPLSRAAILPVTTFERECQRLLPDWSQLTWHLRRKIGVLRHFVIVLWDRIAAEHFDAV